jgi:hypothetical protein
MPEKAFAVVRTTDGSSKQNSSALTYGGRINPRGLHRLPRREPAQPITARTLPGSSQNAQILSNLSCKHLTVPRRLKQSERSKSAPETFEGLPRFIHAGTDCRDDADPSNNWKA